jgi:hypothetical protein
MPSEDEIRQSQPPPDAAIQKLLADIPDFDPRRRQIEEFQKKWLRRPPEPDKSQERAAAQSAARRLVRPATAPAA